MFGNFILHISKRTLHTILLAIFVLVVVFFAATRTQVGRDELGKQLENQFSERFQGELHIGRLTGNVLNTLYASDVVLLDSLGQQVAYIDSVVVEPKWTYLLRRKFSLHNLILIRPDVTILFREDGSTDLSGVFRSNRDHPVQSASAITLEGVSVEVVNGQISTALTGSGSNRDSLTSAVSRFDFRKAELDSLSLRAQLDFSDEIKQIDVLHLFGRLPDSDLTIASGEAQLNIIENRVSVNQLQLQLGASDVALSGFWDLLPRSETNMSTPFLLELEAEKLEFDELARLWPEMPFRGSASVSAMVQGPVSDLTLSWLRVRHNDSVIELAGTISGYPAELNIDFALSNSTIKPLDLVEFLPGIDWEQFLRVSELSTTAYVQGVVGLDNRSITSIDTRSAFEIHSGENVISGSAVSQGRPDSLSHQLALALEHIDLSEWTGKRALETDISGTFRASGYTTGTEAIHSVVTGQVLNPVWGNRMASRIDVDIDIEPGNVGGRVIILDGTGRTQIDGDLILADEPWADITTRFENTNLGPLLGQKDLFTALRGSFTGSSSLKWDSTFEGVSSLALDSSLISVLDTQSVVEPLTADLTITNANRLPGRPLVELTSTIGSLTIGGSGALPIWSKLSGAWLAGLKHAVLEETSKTLYSTSDNQGAGSTGSGAGSTAGARLPDLALSDILALEDARTAFIEGGFSEPLKSDFSIQVTDGQTIKQFFPQWPAMRGTVGLKGNLTLSPDEMVFSVDVESQSVSVGVREAYGVLGHAEFSADRRPNIAETSAWNALFSADSLVSGKNVFSQSVIEASFEKDQGLLLARTNGSRGLDSLNVALTLRRDPNYIEATWTALNVFTEVGRWNLVQPADFRFYGDATSVTDFGLRFSDNNGSTDQAIEAAGIFSANPDDRLTVDLNRLSLREFSRFAGLRTTLGGIVTTQLAFSGGFDLPKITGDATIQSFSLDHRILGDVILRSDYLSGSPDAAVLLQLLSLPENRPAIIAGTDQPGIPFENRLTVSGRMRLPGSDPENRGFLDLFADIDRADLFFMDYIFSTAIDSPSGFVSGDGTITGSFGRPVFDLNLAIIDGRFDVPKTQSSYRLEGDVRVDEEAIRFTSATIRDTQGGLGRVSGRILFNNYQFFSLDIDARLDDLQIMNISTSEELPFYGFLWASGDLLLTGPLDDASLFSSNAVTRANSELFIPIEEDLSETDESFIVFEDSLGVIPNFKQLSRRAFILSRRPDSERTFLDGLNLDLSIYAPVGSTVHLVIDPLLGDVINAKSTGTVQLFRSDDAFQVFGQLAVQSGDYLFTAGELFYRRFDIGQGGTIVWNGDPVNAVLNIPASYHTRASRAGLPGSQANATGLIPLIVNLQISGTVMSPQVDLSLSIDRASQSVLGNYQALEAQLNQPDRATEYATSVLLTNSFRLSTDNISTDSGNQLAFNSVSQLVSAQLNRFLSEALPNVDFSFGLLGENAADLDVTYGVALRLLDERLIIRGEGVYQGTRATENVRTNEGLQGEFVVEIRLSPSVSVEVFFRRESDILETSELTNTTGVGLSYQTDFESWRALFDRITTNTQD